MGTKRTLGPVVRDAIASCNQAGRAADLFSGMAAIAQHLSYQRSVFLNDVMAFPTVFAKAHCLENTRRTPKTLLPEIYPLFREHRMVLQRKFADRIVQEKAALTKGRRALSDWILSAKHVGNTPAYRRMAEYSDNSTTSIKYRLATLYFGSGYFSTAQAIDLDSLRFAFDSLRMSRQTAAPVLAVWLATASRIINSPGHSAQFLKPTHEGSFRRVRSQMCKDVWETFTVLAHEFEPWGSSSWRNGNTVGQGDALNILDNSLPSDVSVVYADPPYTKDQYSRFYHVFETLLLYDFPESNGVGRYRDGRYFSPFCQTTEVVGAFDRLFDGVKNLGLPLVLSYPSDGMLKRAGVNIRKFVRENFRSVKTIRIPSTHSTLGGSKGQAKKNTIEYVFICK